MAFDFAEIYKLLLSLRDYENERIPIKVESPIVSLSLLPTPVDYAAVMATTAGSAVSNTYKTVQEKNLCDGFGEICTDVIKVLVYFVKSQAYQVWPINVNIETHRHDQVESKQICLKTLKDKLFSYHNNPDAITKEEEKVAEFAATETEAAVEKVDLPAFSVNVRDALKNVYQDTKSRKAFYSFPLDIEKQCIS
ncbi:hypothetical protein Tco_1539691 [Tanacetum coccineum]